MKYAIPIPDTMLTSACTFNCTYCFHGRDKEINMDMDKFIEYIDGGTFMGIYPFGGEPMLRLDALIQLKTHVETTMSEGDDRRERLLSNIRGIITNGTMVPERIKDLKKHNFNIQISMDGPRDLQEKYRKVKNGKSSYDVTMAAINACISNDVEWSTHGVITKDTIGRLVDITKFFIRIHLEHNTFENMAGMLQSNFFQIIFEEDYTIEDAHLLSDQVEEAYNWIKTTDEIPENLRDDLASKFLRRRSGICDSGTSLVGVTSDFQVSACHRSALSETMDHIGNVDDVEGFTRDGKKQFNSLHRLRFRHQRMYSTETPITKDKVFSKPCWFYWCPITNYETTGSIYYQNPKFNMMVTVLHDRIEKILTKEQETNGSTGE